MVTAGEIVTDDRWDGAAVSRRMRLKTGGFAPTPLSTNMIMYTHNLVPIWSCTNTIQYQYVHVRTPLPTLIWPYTNILPICSYKQNWFYYMGQTPFFHANSKNVAYNDKKYISFCENVENYIVCFRPPSCHECCTFNITKHVLHYTGSHWLGLFCAIHLECSVRCFVLAQPPIPNPAQKHSSMIHLTFNITPPIFSWK